MHPRPGPQTLGRTGVGKSRHRGRGRGCMVLDETSSASPHTQGRPIIAQERRHESLVSSRHAPDDSPGPNTEDEGPLTTSTSPLPTQVVSPPHPILGPHPRPNTFTQSLPVPCRTRLWDSFFPPTRELGLRPDTTRPDHPWSSQLFPTRPLSSS